MFILLNIFFFYKQKKLLNICTAPLQILFVYIFINKFLYTYMRKLT